MSSVTMVTTRCRRCGTSTVQTPRRAPNKDGWPYTPPGWTYHISKLAGEKAQKFFLCPNCQIDNNNFLKDGNKS